MKASLARHGLDGAAPTRVHLSPTQRAELQQLLRTGRTELRLARRASYVLARAEGHSICEIAREMHTVPRQVRTWCRRFSAKGIEGLRDHPRPGRPRTLSPKRIRRR